MTTNGWSWTPKEGRSTPLRYEPGNWGDLLKAAWFVRILPWLEPRAPRQRIWDLFAGARTYPCPPSTRRRLDRLGDPLVQEAVAPFLERDEWPSAAALTAALVGDRPSVLTVCDKDPARLETFRADSRFTVVPGDGWALAREIEPVPFGFVVLDPYDYLEEWEERAPASLGLSLEATTLLYVFNRSAQGRERFRAYRDFRNTLTEARKGIPGVLGRAPADGFLPAAHHELFFLPSERAAQDGGTEALLQELEAAAAAVARAVRASADSERV